MSDELPSTVYRVSSSALGIVGHVDPNCSGLRAGSDRLEVSTELIREAGGRICRKCGDGREFDHEGGSQ